MRYEEKKENVGAVLTNSFIIFTSPEGGAKAELVTGMLPWRHQEK